MTHISQLKGTRFRELRLFASGLEPRTRQNLLKCQPAYLWNPHSFYHITLDPMMAASYLSFKCICEGENHVNKIRGKITIRKEEMSAQLITF